jgi:hypothetical protein
MLFKRVVRLLLIVIARSAVKRWPAPGARRPFHFHFHAHDGKLRTG